MLGKQYLKYFPREVFRMTSGLTLYESMFRSDDGSIGIVSGPHSKFSQINRTAHFAMGLKCFYSQAAKSYLEFSPKSSNVPLLGNKDEFRDPELVKLLTGNSCTREDTESTNSHENPSSLRNGEFPCLFDDPFSGGKRVFFMSNDKMCVRQRCQKCLKIFEQVEKSGTEVSYVCMDCRNGRECLTEGIFEEISIQEESTLPFIADPETSLVENDKHVRSM